ncbi:magnesium and cobalt transport protein CorA [Gordonia shandongensis]|uniref:magnesium and cobalt transport protein CorA n=1 Tax=Gordonia shandongensis TaxID=376351 RepID=UPI000423734D|nr:magnesium and cobalt transport protein CorA [Gordonia shandongensis]
MPSIPRRPSGPRPDRRGTSDRPAAAPQPVDHAVIDYAIYVDGRREPAPPDFHDALARVRTTGEGFVWLGLHEPDERQMNEVAAAFDLHPLMVEDAVHAHQRPKLELYDDTVFLVLRTVKYLAHESFDRANDIVETGEIMVIAGRDFVLTVRHGEHTHLAGVRSRLERSPEHLALGPATVVHAVADRVVDSYVDVVNEMEDDVDELEERTFAASSRDIDIDVVYLFKREVLQLRRAVAPLASPLSLLAGNKTAPVARAMTPNGKEIRKHFRDVADHLTAVDDMVAEYDDRLTTLLNAAATKVNIQMNNDMRKISAWAAIAAIPTAVAGIYGMNFDVMPELHLEYSYPILLVVLLAACFTLWRVFHRYHWL